MDLDLAGSTATESLGQALARSLPGARHPGAAHAAAAVGGAAVGAGAVLYLEGELGAGRPPAHAVCLHSASRRRCAVRLTRWWKPTASAELICVHVDLYRVQTTSEVEELGLRDMTGPGYLMLIEWPEKGGVAVPPADLVLQLNYKGDARSALLSGGD